MQRDEWNRIVIMGKKDRGESKRKKQYEEGKGGRK